VSWSYDKPLKIVTVRVKQTQKTDGETPVFRTPVDIRVTTGRGAKTYRADVEKADEEFHFPWPTRPKMVEFDPDNWIPKTLKFEKKKEELLYQLEESATVVGRIQACEGLGKIIGDDEVVAGLGRKLKSKDYYGVRIAAAEALGSIAGDAVRDALLAGLADKKSRVRRAVVAALGKVKQERVAKRLETVFGRDKSYFVAAEAARSIAKIREEKAYDFLVGALKYESHCDVVRGAVFDALVELKDARGIREARAWAGAGKPLTVRTSAIVALGRLGRELEKRRERDRVRNDLVELLRHEHFRVRRAAVAGLGELADEAAIGELEKVLANDPLPHLRSSARRAIKRIREETGKQARIGKLEKELGTRRDENKDLKRRLDGLERKLTEVSGGGRRKASRKR
jgi:aminopeptidase N